MKQQDTVMKRIDKVRRDKGMTQAEMGAFIGITSRTYQNYLKGLLPKGKINILALVLKELRRQ